MEWYKVIGSSFGYLMSAIALITLIVKAIRGKLGGFVKQESNAKCYGDRLDKLEVLIAKSAEDNAQFHDRVLGMLNSLGHASKQLLANSIEDTYNQKKNVRQLNSTELKRVVNAYDIYHNELGGNSYISEIYREMTEDWAHV